MNYNEALQKRYSVKKFDSTRKVSEETLKNILEAGKLSASSLGLQPYKIYIAESDGIKQKLIEAFYNPSQISTCSHLIAIVSRKFIEDDYVDNYFSHISGVREIPLEKLDPFRNSINYYRGKHNLDEMSAWNEKQGYILLGNLMFAAALEGVDSCPMEGFIPEKINEIFEIDTATEHVSVTLALGYRAEDDLFQHFKKVRKPDEKLYRFF